MGLQLAVYVQIIRAHLIPETVNYFNLSAQTQTGLQLTYHSLQGLPWTFAWQLSPDKTTGALVLIDLYLVTGSRGYFDIQADLSNTDQAKWCATSLQPKFESCCCCVLAHLCLTCTPFVHVFRPEMIPCLALHYSYGCWCYSIVNFKGFVFVWCKNSKLSLCIMLVHVTQCH